jgi:hypothetical protein
VELSKILLLGTHYVICRLFAYVLVCISFRVFVIRYSGTSGLQEIRVEKFFFVKKRIFLFCPCGGFANLGTFYFPFYIFHENYSAEPHMHV